MKGVQRSAGRRKQHGQQPLIESLRSADSGQQHHGAAAAASSTSNNSAAASTTATTRSAAVLAADAVATARSSSSPMAAAAAAVMASRRRHPIDPPAAQQQQFVLQRQHRSAPTAPTAKIPHLPQLLPHPPIIMTPPSVQRNNNNRHFQPNSMFTSSSGTYTPPPVPPSPPTSGNGSSNSSWSAAAAAAAAGGEVSAAAGDNTGNTPRNNNTSTTAASTGAAADNSSMMLNRGEPSRSQDDEQDDHVAAAAAAVELTPLSTKVPLPAPPSQHQRQDSKENFLMNNTNNNNHHVDPLMMASSAHFIATKIPSEDNLIMKIRTILVKSGLLYFLIFIITAAGLVYGVGDALGVYEQTINWELSYNVGFLGNAYFFVNDVPRLLESVSGGYIYQNSCIRPGGSLRDLWKRGNGMYNLWQSEEAIIDFYKSSDDDDDQNGNDDGSSYNYIYDFGLCSVRQMLAGYDEYMIYGNAYGKYYDDNLNPCIVNTNYANFIDDQLLTDEVKWDYVILVDQTKRMAVEDARNVSIQVLMNGYGPLLKESGAIPILVDTHAFWTSKSNMTGLYNIPTFTKFIHDGVQEYQSALAELLPRKQTPIIAPIGIAYLTIWEEKYGLWRRLFVDDNIHSSWMGSYLFVLVLYATIFGHMPNEEYMDNIPRLFKDARKLVGNNDDNEDDNGFFESYSRYSQAIEYLQQVAKRVTIQKYVPKSFYEYESYNEINDDDDDDQ